MINMFSSSQNLEQYKFYNRIETANYIIKMLFTPWCKRLSVACIDAVIQSSAQLLLLWLFFIQLLLYKRSVQLLLYMWSVQLLFYMWFVQLLLYMWFVQLLLYRFKTVAVIHVICTVQLLLTRTCRKYIQFNLIYTTLNFQIHLGFHTIFSYITSLNLLWNVAIYLNCNGL